MDGTEEKNSPIGLETVTFDTDGPQPNGKTVDEEEGAPKMSEFEIIKNAVVVSLGFTCLFTAFNSMANLQTSLNREEGVGAWSLSTIYISLIISCMFLPNFIIARLGCKWTIPLSMIGYILYMGANFYAIKGTMIPASIVLGLGAAPLWSAKCTYLTQIAVWYSKIRNLEKDGVINLFFGVFFLCFQSSQIWGNLISSLVFAPDTKNITNSSTCGAQFCPGDDDDNSTQNFDQVQEKIYIVCGIYLGFACLAALIVIFLLDTIVQDKETSEEDRKLSPNLLLSTFRHLISSRVQLLLVPITIYSGVEQAFLQGDFTKSFISCTLGIWNLGYVMICYGVVDAICSVLFGQLVQYVGHIPFFILAFVTHGSVQLGLLFWEPQADQEIIFYVIAALWGMGDAVIQTQLNALYGHLFSGSAEAAFANYRLWESVGFAVTYAYNDYLCTNIKLYICLGVLAVSMVGYTMVEAISNKSKKTKANISG